MIPIEPLTATSANLTYDLGSTEWRWRELYARSIDLSTATTTGFALNISGMTSGANPGFSFKIGGTEKWRISNNLNATSTAGIGQYAESGSFSVNVSSASGVVANSTLTIISVGRPVVFCGVNGGISSEAISTNQLACTVSLIVNGVSHDFGSFTFVDNTATARPIMGIAWNPSFIGYYSGTVTAYLTAVNVSDPDATAAFSGKLTAFVL